MEKNKKKKRYKPKTSGDQNFQKIFAEMLEAKTKEFASEFQAAVKGIPEIFRKFSVQDIATSLFVSDLWLPNVSSLIKHQFFAAIFASMRPEDFSGSDVIISYDHLKKLMEKLYRLSPTFFSLEDYVPEPDWGEVKFYHEEKIFKIFYGNELSNVYDYLILFQILYLPFNEKYFVYANRSATEELRNCLRLQDDIISSISSQTTAETTSKISPGHIEVPPEAFWENAVDFYNNYNPIQKFDDSFLKSFSIPLGNWDCRYLKGNIFCNMASVGKVLPAFFILHGDRYFPILPRRYSSILFDNWANIFRKYHNKVVDTGISYPMTVGAELHKYIKKRVTSSLFYPLVGAVGPDGSLHDLLFSSAFVSKDRLILVYVTNPSYSKHKTEEELSKLAPKFNEAINFISNPPITLPLHLDRKNVQFQSSGEEGESLKPTLFVVIPQVSTEFVSISIPESLPGTVMTMDQFLGIIDELENADMLASFVEYQEEYSHLIAPSIITPLDVFGSFKSSYGVLVGGALGYNFISLDPHWGSNMRYETLSKFWKLYPPKHFFDHPRSWKVKKETETRIRLDARSYFGCALYSQVGQTHVFLNAPFDKMTYEQGSLANLMMECLEDSLSRNRDLINGVTFFQKHDQFQVLFFPLSLIKNNERFRHLEHLDPQGKYWVSDYGEMMPGVYGIRVVLEDKLLVDALVSVQDRSLEIDFLFEILAQLNQIEADPFVESIRADLDRERVGRPRFKMSKIRKKASFPEFINPYNPENSHFKMARKIIAELARKCNLSEGSYVLEDAKVKLNSLREALVDDINSEVGKYDFEKAAPYLLTRIDGLNDYYERSITTLEGSLTHDVDYCREEVYARNHSDYLRMNRNYRYLIEKFVQKHPQGKEVLNKDRFQYLIALIDWLHVFYTASDSLHYEIHTTGMKVDRNFLVEAIYDEDIGKKEKEFVEQEAKIKLGIIGNPKDIISSPRPLEKFLDVLDASFKRDLGFTFRSMINVLQILSHWPEFRENIEISPFYSASEEEIKETCLKSVKEMTSEEVKPILDFLILKSTDVVKLIGQDEDCSDLPVWEHKKRYARYNLRPLILIGWKYFWGPYSTRRSGLIWSGSPHYGTLPIDLQSPSIQQVLKSEKKLIEKALVVKGLEILRRYTSFSGANVKLHKIDKKKKHPLDLGDYDILAFYPDKNVVFNIECKDILPVFCLKDAKTLRETIFGEPGRDEGHFTQINKRQSYLSNHLLEIARSLRWPLNIDNRPEIITIYLTRITYWWTKYPPYKINTVFLQVDLLKKFIDEL